MEIVTGAPTSTFDRDEASRLVLEMAAVVRTIFGAPATADQSVASDQSVARINLPPVIQAPAIPMIEAVPVPVLPVLTVPALPASPVLPVLPALPVPLAAPEVPDSAERHSLVLLQEIAFLDD